MSLPANTNILRPPTNRPEVSYGDLAYIDELNSYPNGFAIDLSSAVGAYIAKVPCKINITVGSSASSILIKNASGNQSVNVLVYAVGGTVDGKPFFKLVANGQFTEFVGDGAGNLTTS
jgi:hypothetical protein